MSRKSKSKFPGKLCYSISSQEIKSLLNKSIKGGQLAGLFFEFVDLNKKSKNPLKAVRVTRVKLDANGTLVRESNGKKSIDLLEITESIQYKLKGKTHHFDNPAKAAAKIAKLTDTKKQPLYKYLEGYHTAFAAVDFVYFTIDELQQMIATGSKLAFSGSLTRSESMWNPAAPTDGASDELYFTLKIEPLMTLSASSSQTSRQSSGLQPAFMQGQACPVKWF